MKKRLNNPDAVVSETLQGMHALTRMIKDDMKVSLGVTEPGAIALAVAKARSLTGGELRAILLDINSGIYKNAFTCAIPGTNETGNQFAAALGAVAGDWTRGLAALDGVTDEDVQAARILVNAGKVEVTLHEISSALYVRATVNSELGTASVTIEGTHDHIAKVEKNGAVVEEHPYHTARESDADNITAYSLADLWSYTAEVPADEIAFIEEAYEVNLRLMEAGAKSQRTDLCKSMIADNGNALVSTDELKTAQALTAAAIEARVRGLDLPAMSIAGSGNHGIISTMPLYASATVRNLSAEALHRATALGYLVTMYIKAYSGKLSAFCGCAIAAGTGMAVGRLFLLGGTLAQAGLVISNMASSLTGVICTGGNPACVLKAAIAVDIGHKAVDMALQNIAVAPEHGIIGSTPEETMRFMGRIASPGMQETEETIIEIFKEKL